MLTSSILRRCGFPGQNRLVISSKLGCPAGILRTLPRSSTFLKGRCSSTAAGAAAATKPTAQKAAYPERLLVYHAGTGKTVFLGCLKVTTIFIFFFFSLIVAPAHWQSADEPAWVAPLVLLSGAVPMMFVAYTTRPFASYVHLRLPAYARYSREYLHRYAAKLPKTAAMDITTISFFGRPRVNKVVVGDLYPAKSTFGIANFARDTMAIDAKRPWWLGKSVSAFSLSAEEGNSREKGLWTNIVKSISSTSR